MCKRDEESHVLCLVSQLNSYPYHHMAGLVIRFKPAQGHACDISEIVDIQAFLRCRSPKKLLLVDRQRPVVGQLHREIQSDPVFGGENGSCTNLKSPSKSPIIASKRYEVLIGLCKLEHVFVSQHRPGPRATTLCPCKVVPTWKVRLNSGLCCSRQGA